MNFPRRVSEPRNHKRGTSHRVFIKIKAGWHRSTSWGADKAALDQWELRLLRPAPIGSQVGARENVKTFWTRVSRIGGDN